MNDELAHENTTNQPTTVAVSWQDTLQTFLDTLGGQRTRIAYRRAVNEAMGAIGATSIQELTVPVLASYRARLVARLDQRGLKRLSPASVSLKLAALRSFLNFCRLTGHLDLAKDVVAFTLKLPHIEVQKPYQVLSEEERTRMLEAARGRGPRDLALAMLALGSGLRVSELVSVRLQDLYQDDEKTWWVRVVQGKGRKDRLIPLGNAVIEAVQEWLKASSRSLQHKADRSSYLFTTRQSGKMSTERAWQVVKALAKEIGIEKPISPHSLRHGYALDLLRRGASPVVVQKLLGHASLLTTQRYTDHLEVAELKKWVFSPK